ncbi:MAG: hypothetical protein L0H93_19700, partial [Nocardioides sp.]|nr:hypothetical protein [Nocardioides sp.]
MRRSRRWAIPAALGLASACLLAPAAAYSPAEDDPIDLGSVAADSPVVQSGIHRMILPPGENASFFRVEREIPGSTVWLGQHYVSDELENSWVSMRAEDGGERCDYEDFRGSDYHGHKFMTGGMRIDPQCQNGSTVTFEEQP